MIAEMAILTDNNNHEKCNYRNATEELISRTTVYFVAQGGTKKNISINIFVQICIRITWIKTIIARNLLKQRLF